MRLCALMVMSVMIGIAGVRPADAAVITYNFSGTTNSSAIAGTAATFSGTFSYDPAAVAVSSTPTLGSYLASQEISFTSGSYTSIMSFLDSGGIAQVVDNQGYDEFQILVYSGSYKYLNVRFFDATSTAFNSTSLPTALTLSSFTSAEVGVSDDSGRVLSGTLTSLALASPPTSPVPEPATWSLMVAGFGMIGGAHRVGAKAIKGLGRSRLAEGPGN